MDGTKPYSFEKTKQFWSDFYSKINLDDCLNIFVYSDINGKEKIIDNKKYFEDKDNELINNVFHLQKGCYGIMVINQNGKFISYNWHYNEKQLAEFINFVSN